MSEHVKTKRRIVSKGRFLFKSGQKSSFLALGLLLLGIGIMCVLPALFTLVCALWNRDWDLLVSALSEGGIGVLFGWGGAIFLKESNSIEPGVPWTRANTTALPAEESLVRASDEPSGSETTLLRAANAGQSTLPEELVRPMQVGNSHWESH